jgi:hypothetical protein
MARKQTPALDVVQPDQIEQRIYLIRGQKVILDSVLAELYRVETRVLIQAVKRNLDRFPEDFMFQLEPGEAECLRSQVVMSKVGRGGRRYLPYVFTEHGVAMLSSVLRSQRAVQMNILIVRAFVRMRDLWRVTRIWRRVWINWNICRIVIRPSLICWPTRLIC